MKFLFLYRNSADPQQQPSAAEMQAGYTQWKSWMTRHAKEILEQPPARSGPKPGGAAAVTLHTGLADVVPAALDVLELHDLLSSLAHADARAAEGVELRCFGGYTEPEIADIQGVTERTVQRDWRKARAFLMSQLTGHA